MVERRRKLRKNLVCKRRRDLTAIQEAGNSIGEEDKNVKGGREW